MKTNTLSPSAAMNGIVFYPVPEFDDPSCAFGADEKDFFPRRSLPDVPTVFEDMVQSLFFSGGKLPEFAPEVDKQKANRAIRAWLSSFAPAHEAKVATVAYALWLWTDRQVMASISKEQRTKT